MAIPTDSHIDELLLNSLPHPAMLIDRDRRIVGANGVALEAGAVVGGYCWQTFGGGKSISDESKHLIAGQADGVSAGGVKCTFCCADEALTAQEAVNTEVNVDDEIFDTWWVPVTENLFLHYAIDLTERRRLEQQLQQSQKMEAIGTLASGIAHDFNNILGIIMGCTELAMTDLASHETARRHLAESLQATERARDLVKQILTFSRQTNQERRALDLRRIVEETMQLLRATLPATIDIRQNLRGKTGLIQADPTQIRQVVMNIATNAAHAMQRGGGTLSICIESTDNGPDASVRFPNLPKGSYVRLTIEDTGEGMSPETLERAFDPYFTTKEAGEGTGLGLAVVRGIIESHGAAIDVQSETGVGTSFEILFPRTETPHALVGPAGSQPIPTGSEHILFVDDESAMVNIYKPLLERFGYTVTTRTSSIEALEAFKANPDRFDVVITDQTMPNITGEVLAREILAIRPEIPVILCSGHSDYLGTDTEEGSGIAATLLKPIGQDEMARTIRSVVAPGK